MSFEQIFPGCAVRWEDDRPFEVELSAELARDSDTTGARIAYVLALRGWRVVLDRFGRESTQRLCEGCGRYTYIMILEASWAERRIPR